MCKVELSACDLSDGFWTIVPKPTVDTDPLALTIAKSPKLKVKLAFAAYPPWFLIPEARISFTQSKTSLDTLDASWFLTPNTMVLIFPILGRPFT